MKIDSLMHPEGGDPLCAFRRGSLVFMLLRKSCLTLWQERLYLKKVNEQISLSD